MKFRDYFNDLIEVGRMLHAFARLSWDG